MLYYAEGDYDRGSGNNSSAKMLSSAILNNDFLTAENILRLSDEFKNKPGLAKSTLQSILHRCAKMGNIVGASWCITRLTILGVLPNTLSFNAIIAACSKTGNVKLASDWWVKMISEGVMPNNITYNTMIHTCAQAGDLRSAVYWMTELLNSDVEPCKVSFAAIISSFSKTGHLNEAEAWYQKMVDLQIRPDTVIFNTLICACAKGGNLDRAEYWLAQMEASNLSPDQKTYNSLINIAAKAGDLQKAISLYKSMLLSGEVPDMYTYGSILNACSSVADLASAEDVMSEIGKRGLQPNLVCYNTIITCCANCNNAEKAIIWYDRLRRQGLIGKRNTLNSLLIACVNAERKDLVEKALEMMISCGFSPDRSNLLKLGSLVDKENPLGSEWPYFVVLKACIRAQSCGELKRLLSQIPSPRSLSDTFVEELTSYANGLGVSKKILDILRTSLAPRHTINMKDYYVDDTHFSRLYPYTFGDSRFSAEMMNMSWSVHDAYARYDTFELTETNMHQHEKTSLVADSHLSLKRDSLKAGVENQSFPSTTVPTTDILDAECFRSNASSQSPPASELRGTADRITSLDDFGPPPGLTHPGSACTLPAVPPESLPDVPLAWLDA